MYKKMVFCVVAMSLTSFTVTLAHGAGLVLIGLGELDNAATNCRTKIMNNMARALRDKSLAQFMSHLKELRGKTKDLKTKIDASEQNADEVIRKLRAMHNEKNVDRWERPRRELYEKAVAQKKAAQRARGELKGLIKEMRQIHGHSSLRNAKAFAANTAWFRQRLQRMMGQVEKIGGGTGSGGGRPGGGSDGMKTMGESHMLRIRNDGKDVWYLVNGSWLKPGKETTSNASQLVIRAMAMTKRRDFVMHKKATRNATITEQSPYAFRFNVNVGGRSGTTSWECTEEEYTWSARSSAGPMTPSVSTTKRTKDTLTWKPPLLRKALGQAIKVFTFGTRGSLKWSYSRRGNMGNVSKSEFEHFHSTLTVFVNPT